MSLPVSSIRPKSSVVGRKIQIATDGLQTDKSNLQTQWFGTVVDNSKAPETVCGGTTQQASGICAGNEARCGKFDGLVVSLCDDSADDYPALC